MSFSVLARATDGPPFSGGEQVRMKPCLRERIEKLPEREELLMKKKDFVKEKIEQELLFVKENSRTNRGVALQALRRKKWYEKLLKDIDSALKAMTFAHEQIDFVNKVTDQIKDITEEQDGAHDMSDTICKSVSFEVKFDENELVAELERLEKNQDENLLEEDRMEERVPCSKVSSTVSPTRPAKTEEEEIEEQLEYLQCWLNELS